MAAPRKPQELHPIRIPFIGVPLSRDTTTKDQRYVNVLIETLKNPITDNKRTFIIKRPGLAASTQPPAASKTGRGVYHWSKNGNIYSVFHDKIYSGTTDLGVTLAGTSGKCWFAQTAETSSITRLAVSDGTKLYLIDSADSVTTVSTASDAQFPTANLGPVIFFNNYFYFGKSNGELWNSDADGFTSYVSTSFQSSEMFPDDLEAIARQKDQFIALGKFSTEFYYDNANPVGSPLQRIDQNALQIGLVTKNSLCQAEDVIVWCSAARDGGYTIWRLDDLNKLNKISTEPLDRLLDAEGSSISSCTSFMFRAFGHLVYGINLSSANRTLMYDTEENMWFEWADTAGNKFNCSDATEKNGTVYLQDASNGRIYTLSASTFRDNGVDFTVTLQTSAYDFDISDRKFQPVLDVYGDSTTGNLAVSVSDNDYSSFITARNIDMSAMYKRLTRLGSFFKRAFKFTYTDNYALRLEGFQVKIKMGLH